MQINSNQLERIFNVFYDIRKILSYNKSTGQWAWVDRDEQDNLEAYHNGFKTAFEAMQDAVEPYLADSN